MTRMSPPDAGGNLHTPPRRDHTPVSRRAAACHVARRDPGHTIRDVGQKIVDWPAQSKTGRGPLTCAAAPRSLAQGISRSGLAETGRPLPGLGRTGAIRD
jgi:hypothetical protein